ncbi:MAG: hypothetical protein H0W89_04760 [Candidatus Levybacteria bacterium]|nr:hypothetical protein [Candidatus Levybacteria bacterium]
MIIAQKPNIPIIIATVGFIISYFTAGMFQAIGETVSIIALIIWAYLEISSGVNWFRKLLGGVVLLVVAYGLFNTFSIAQPLR